MIPDDHMVKVWPTNLKPFTKKMAEWGDLISLSDFQDAVKCGGFVDYDGYGYLVYNKRIDTDFIVKPSEVKLIPKDATHILWFNR